MAEAAFEVKYCNSLSLTMKTCCLREIPGQADAQTLANALRVTASAAVMEITD